MGGSPNDFFCARRSLKFSRALQACDISDPVEAFKYKAGVSVCQTKYAATIIALLSGHSRSLPRHQASAVQEEMTGVTSLIPWP
jgi:hypothetical protein